jgi:hypothetical protein
MTFMGLWYSIDSKRRGRHQWDIPFLQYSQTTEVSNMKPLFYLHLLTGATHVQMENTAWIMYCAGILCSKLSILFLFIEVFVIKRRGVVFCVNMTIVGCNILFYVAMIFALALQCIPRAKITIPGLPGRCIDIYPTYMVTAVFNVLSDFFILCFPVWAIWQLQMPNNRKFCSTVSFTAGILYVHFLVKVLFNRDRPLHPPLADRVYRQPELTLVSLT